MNVDTYKNGRKILNVTEIDLLEKSAEPISLKTSTKIRELKRFCDYKPSSKTNTIYRNLQDYSKTELNTINYWATKYRKPKSSKYVFYMRAGWEYGGWFKYCFLEDTTEFTKQEKEIVREEQRGYRRWLKEEKEYRKDQLKRQNGIWKTSWQWLAQDKRKVKDKAIPISKFNWLYDDFRQEFYQEDTEYYYYSQYDTEKVTEEEYKKLKDLYIKKFGGWERIDLENTEYNGKKWY